MEASRIRIQEESRLAATRMEIKIKTKPVDNRLEGCSACDVTLDGLKRTRNNNNKKNRSNKSLNLIFFAIS